MLDIGHIAVNYKQNHIGLPRHLIGNLRPLRAVDFINPRRIEQKYAAAVKTLPQGFRAMFGMTVQNAGFKHLAPCQSVQQSRFAHAHTPEDRHMHIAALKFVEQALQLAVILAQTRLSTGA